MATREHPTFEAPDSGHWILDRSHYDGGLTRISAELMGNGVALAYEGVFEILGIPLRTVEARSVHNFVYASRRPLVAPKGDSTRQPPDWLLKLVLRIHPAFRRRNRAAAAYFENPQSRVVVADWHREIRPRQLARNTELQSVDLASLDTQALSTHLDELIDHMRWSCEEHHRLHGYDLFPIGLLVAACQGWGIDADDVLPLLTGASPSTTEPATQRHELRLLIEEAGADPASLDEVRAASPECAAALDRYLDRHGAVLFSSYDLDGPTLAERPAVVLATILNARAPLHAHDHIDGLATAVRNRVPADQQAAFDTMLSEARDAMDMRDDNGPLTVEWPVGLLRLGLLEAGRRLADDDRIDQPEHMFELESHEIAAIVNGAAEPSAEVLAARATTRAANRRLDPPITLGPDEAEPDLDLFPDAMRQMLDIVATITEHMMTPSTDDGSAMAEVGVVRGVGIGTEAFEGTARIAESAEDALMALEDQEILVTRATSPAFNLVLSMAGALVTAEGGAMAHAAVLARELDLPAVIGAAGCMDTIADGDTIRVDPAAGVVTVISSSTG